MEEGAGTGVLRLVPEMEAEVAVTDVGHHAAVVGGELEA